MVDLTEDKIDKIPRLILGGLRKIWESFMFDTEMQGHGSAPKK